VGVAHRDRVAGHWISAIAQWASEAERDGVTADRLTPERELLALRCPRIIGVDEAGRGPLAGPVVAAAVVLPIHWIQDGMPAELEALNDSKQLSASQRDAFFERLMATPGFESGIARVGPDEIDRINILQATHQAMREAIRLLGTAPGHALVDGRSVPRLGVPQTALIKGDSRSYSIAAASVLAKVTRDREMLEADRRWPGYGFARHKGYGTADHLEALVRLGPCPLHRRSFAPLRKPEPDLFSS
jgi:ribonuclease HII